MYKSPRCNFKLNPIAASIALALASQFTVNLAHAGAGWGDNIDITNTPIKVQTYYANSPSGIRPDPMGGAAINTGTALRKFVDTLPGLGPTKANNLGQYIPVAAPEKWVDGNGNLTNDDYYEIAVIEYTEKMHSDLSKATHLRGYVQLSTAKNPGKRVPLTYPVPNGAPAGTAGAPILDTTGAQVYAYDNPHYLGPLINANKGVAVRIKYTNYLPVGGGLFIPVDKTLPGAGVGSNGVTMYTENRADIHWHGGDTPWISDGTPHQWIAPAGETAAYAAGMGKGVSAQNVPDMPDPGPGSNTLYFPNNISGRFMFYHDHTIGLTRLNVYAGIAAGYLLNDPVEQAMMASGVLPVDQIPLVIQDKTFVPKDIAQQDAKWDTTHWGQEGDLWFPHVYETNQDPNSFDGTNPVGRWDWGPWFWPVFPAQYSIPTGAYGDVTTTPEAYMDTPIINGTAYPTVTVDPKAYRFRILNASNDRFINLGVYKADMTVAAATGVAGTEVKMVPAVPSTDPLWPATWPTDGRVGGVPDPYTAGPNIVQIGSEGGFLPNPVTIASQPISYEQNRRSVTILNVLEHGLYMGPAERADVVIDFSQYAGQTLILYNDAPAPVPAFDPRIDYFTGDGDQTGAGGAGNTLPGYGPNTRTMMQIKVSAIAPAAAFNSASLVTALPAAYGAIQERPIIPEVAYNAPFGTNDQNNLALISTGAATQPNFSWTPTLAGQTVASINLVGGGTGYTTAPAVVLNGGVALFTASGAAIPGNQVATATATINPVTHMVTGITVTNAGAGYSSAPVITLVGGGGIGASATVQTSATQSLPVLGKAIQELFDPVYGRMNATLGVELPFTNNIIQTTIPLAYVDPATESIADGETQIWKITHNGVDTHPVHFHLLNVQVINRIGWDGTVKPNPDNEMGWKETLKMNPLEDVVVAVRAKRPLTPFGLPKSVRAMDPSQPLGSTLGFNQVNITNNVPKVIANAIADYDNEYVWHCHILGHEENDFMRPFVLHPIVTVPDAPSNLRVAAGLLNWTDSTPAGGVDAASIPTLGNAKNEIGFSVQKSVNGGAFVQVAKTLANATSWQDPATPAAGSAYSYQVVAFNAAGNSLQSNVVGTSSTASAAPAALVFASQQSGTPSASQAVTFSNTGTLPLTFTSATFGGTNAPAFAQTNNCPVTLAGGASCTVNVTFNPQTIGLKSAILRLSGSAGIQRVTLTGTGVTAAASVATTSLVFASQQVGTPSASQAVTLRNTGLGPLSFTSATFAGTNAPAFKQTNNCPAILAVAASCSINVTFNPQTIGSKSATLKISDAAGIQTVALSGTGMALSASGTPAALVFASQKVATPSARKAVILSNTGTVPLSFSGATIVGTNAPAFTQTNNCPAILPVATSCTVNVTFNPQAVGAKAAFLRLSEAAGLIVVPLSGVGKP